MSDVLDKQILDTFNAIPAEKWADIFRDGFLKHETTKPTFLETGIDNSGFGPLELFVHAKVPSLELARIFKQLDAKG